VIECLNLEKIIKLPNRDVNYFWSNNLRILYKKKPYRAGFDSIVFSRAYKNPGNGSLYYIYSVEYVSDREVIYYLSKEGKLKSRFMISFWGAGGDAKCVPHK
jgi:hypothetical protein